MPKISVILSILNAEDCLGQCLDTILMQTLQDIEIICIDNGSTDGSVGILQTYAMFDERIKVLSIERNIQANVWNIGLNKATGEFVCFIEVEDFYPEDNALETLYQNAKINSVNVCGGELALFNPAHPQLTQDFEENSGFLFSNDSLMEYSFSQFDEGVERFIFNREFLFQNKLCFPKYTHGFEECFLVNVLCVAQKFYALHKIVYAKKTGEDNQFHWTKEKIIDYCSAVIDNLRIANENSYYQLKDLCLVKLMSIWNTSKKYLLPDDVLTILKKMNFLYSDEKKKVSIIIPVYNTEKYLRACLESALRQTLSDIEILCVNDGSTDGSAEILEEYARKDSRIIIITQENKGLGKARNAAFIQATGEYVLYLDSDDTIVPETAEYLYLFAKLFTFDMVSFAAKSIDEKTGEIYDDPYMNFSYLPKNYPPVLNARIARSFLPQMAVSSALTFYQRDFLLNNDIHWDSLNYEDTLFFTESILNANRFGILENQFYNRTMHADSIVGSINDNFGDYCDILSKTFQKVDELSDKALLHYYIHYFLTKAHTILTGKLLPDAQNKFIPKFYQLCIKTLKKYHLALPKIIEIFMTEYTKHLKSKKKKISYYKTLYWVKILKNYYQIPFISLRRFPGGFIFKLFGFPILFKRPPKYQSLLD